MPFTLLLASICMPAAASAEQPERLRLVALVCEPKMGYEVGKAKVQKRRRYIFMNKDASDEVTKLCVDEIGTNAITPTSCTGAKSGSVEVVASFNDWISRNDYEDVIVSRKDASVKASFEHLESFSWKTITHRYACTPSQDANAILTFVQNEKKKQRSGNAF